MKRRILFVSLFLLATAGFARADIDFGTIDSYPTAVDPASVVLVDLDGDDDLDLAVANQGSNSVSVFLNNGTGGMGARTDFPVGFAPASIATGDFDRDGDPDVVVACPAANRASVLLGNGSGGLGSPTHLTTGTGPQSVAVADLNADSNPDIVSANHDVNTVSVFLGNGSGGFGAKTDFATGAGPWSVSLADLDGGGAIDAVVTNFDVNTVSVLLGNGSGGFGAKTDFVTGSGPVSIAIADLNGDTELDLGVANFSGNVSVLLGNGSGGFGAKTDFPAGDLPHGVASADFDGDGDQDLILASAGFDYVSVLTGGGSGTFAAPIHFVTGISPWAVTAGDLDGDDLPDAAVANIVDATVTVLLNSTTAPGCIAALSGTAAWWPLDETSGTFALDHAGSAHGGYVGPVTHPTGKVAGAVSITSVSQYIAAADQAALNFGSGSFTVDAWVRSTNTSTSVRTIVDKRTSSGGFRGYSLYISNNRLGFQLADGSFTNYGAATGILTDGAWHHVAAVVNRAGGTTGGKLYVDGTAVNTFDPTLCPGSVTNTGALRIGQSYNSGSAAFNGDIDEVALHSRALSAAEVASIVGASSFGRCKSTTYTVAGKVFDDVDRDGVHELPGEVGFADRVVESLDVSDNVIASALTDANGNYALTVACGQAYRLRFVVPDGWEAPIGGNLVEGPSGGCGTQIAIIDIGCRRDPCRDTTRVYTTTSDFVSQTLDGVDATGNQIQLSETPTTSSNSEFAWLANQLDGTVSKVSTVTGNEVARYYTGPPDANNKHGWLKPSRIVVDRDGNCWVANRADGKVASVTMILATGGTNTSQDVVPNGQIDPTNAAELLPWGTDQRVVRHYLVGGLNGMARALCFDKTGKLWVGLFNEHRLVKLDPNLAGYAPGGTPSAPPELACVQTVSPGSASCSASKAGKTLFTPYGLALAPNGFLYGTTLNRYAFEVDPGLASGGSAAAPTFVKHIDHLSSNYGIAVDKNCIVWIAKYYGSPGCVRWDPTMTTTPATGWASSTGTTPGLGRGITIAPDNTVWMAVNGTTGGSTIMKYSNTDPPTVLGAFPTTLAEAVSIGIAKDGTILAAGAASDNWTKFDLNGNVMTLPGPKLTGDRPYSYSDFTGNLANMVSQQQGSWTAITAANNPGFYWHHVSWNQSLPAQTSIIVDVRAAASIPALASKAWVTLAHPGGAITPVLKGQYLETRARLFRTITGCNAPFITPVLTDLTVAGECDTCALYGCPRDTVTSCISPAGRVVFYQKPVVGGDCNPNTPVFCTPPPGSLFPLGTTVVTCTATPPGGPTVTCTFKVTVTGDCITTPTGACCGARNVPCIVTTEAACAAMGRVYRGDGTPCTTPCTSGCADPPGGLRAWWPLDNSTANVTSNLAGLGANGTLVGGPTVDPNNQVNGSHVFSGVNQYVSVPSTATVDLGPSDFTFDAWIKTSKTVGLNPILDKRLTPGAVNGYSFFVLDGYLGIQIARNGTSTNYVLSAGNGGALSMVATGTWRHVAVTVRRLSPTGIQFYVNGSPVGATFNPVPRAGTLNNTNKLLIGASWPIGGSPKYFQGQIDEVQIFARQLKAPEVHSIFLAGSAGKCREGCVAPLLVSCCKGWGSMNLTVANYTNASHLYSWAVSPSLGAGCPTVVPTSFVQPAGTVTVPAHSTVKIPVTVHCPSAMTPGQVGCYQLVLFNHDTGKSFGCLGSVRKASEWCVRFGDQVVDLGPLEPVSLGGLDVHNFDFKVVPAGISIGPPGSAPQIQSGAPNFRYRLRPVAGEEDSTSEMLSINGLPAGAAYEDSVTVPMDGSEATIPFSVAYATGQAIGFDRVLLEAVEETPGTYAAIAQLTVRDSLEVSNETVDVPGSIDPAAGARFLTLPNPFSSSTTIRFQLGAPTAVTLAIFDLNGRMVRRFHDDRRLEAGVHQIDWDGRDDRNLDLPVGMYFLRVTTESGVQTAKVTLQR